MLFQMLHMSWQSYTAGYIQLHEMWKICGTSKSPL